MNEPERAAALGRPPQFLFQTRPLAPSTILAYGTLAMPCIAEAANWPMPNEDAGKTRVNE